MIFVRSLLYNVVLFGGSMIVLPPAIFLLLGPRRLLCRAVRVWAWGALGLLRLIVGLRYELRGHVDQLRQPGIFAAKHQSAWDTIIFLLIADDPAYVMKESLMRVPFYGWYARKQGMIPIDREGGGAELRRIMRMADRALKRGQQVIIFPQGTRVPPGTAAPYGPGVAALYTKLERPVIPVALNSGLYWGRRSFQKRPGTIVVEFMDPIPAGLKRREFAALLEDRIETCTRKLEAEAPKLNEA